MMNELRYYLNQIKAAMENEEEPFVPSYIITAITLPTGDIKLMINSSNISEEIDYILESYDDDMRLKSNRDVGISNLMVV